MSKKITLRDVAKHAGVSVTTVSNVVRDWPHVSETTRRKVQHSIHELGYFPNPIAQGLRTGRSQVIGFIVPELTNPHFAAMVSAAEASAQSNGYNMLIFSTHENISREAQFLSYAQNGRVDGLLIVPASQKPHYIHQLLRDTTVPAVMLDRVPNNVDAAYCNVDNFSAVRLALQHLYDLGHTKIAHLSGPSNSLPALQRMEAYQQFVNDFGLSYQVATPNSDSWDIAEGYRAMVGLLGNIDPPTAVIACNDVFAIGASHAIFESGMVIPYDISIVGIDDLDVCQYLNPPLTTVRQPVPKMAQISIEILLDLIQGEQPENIHISLSPELVIRKSTTSPS